MQGSKGSKKGTTKSWTCDVFYAIVTLLSKYKVSDYAFLVISPTMFNKIHSHVYRRKKI